MDDGLQLIIRAWAGLPWHLQRRMLDLARGIDSGRSCPRCGQGPTAVRSSYRKATVQIRSMVCKSCGHAFRQAAPRSLVATRKRRAL